MQAVEFQTKIENGIINVPEQYLGEFAGEKVRVIILSENEPDEDESYLDYLIENPIAIDSKFLTREEIYSGKRFGD